MARICAQRQSVLRGAFYKVPGFLLGNHASIIDNTIDSDQVRLSVRASCHAGSGFQTSYRDPALSTLHVLMLGVRFHPQFPT